jgi:RNA polymerase sigma factor (sigma-70 family)
VTTPTPHRGSGSRAVRAQPGPAPPPTSSGPAATTSHLSPDQAADLVRAAAQGDGSAWDRLVDGYAGLVWATARGFRLSAGDTQDVTQTTWLRLVENVDRLSDPGRVGAWLATTVRRECLRVLRQSKRTVLVDEWDDVVDVDQAVPPDADLVRVEESDAVHASVEQLAPAARALVRLLMLDPPPSYAEVSATLGIPVGSIGPTRQRSLRKLRSLLDERDVYPA